MRSDLVKVLKSPPARDRITFGQGEGEVAMRHSTSSEERHDRTKYHGANSACWS